MGKGDKKTRKGKISIGSYGVKRPHKNPKPEAVISPKAKAVKKPAEKKPAEKKPVEKESPKSKEKE